MNDKQLFQDLNEVIRQHIENVAREDQSQSATRLHHSEVPEFMKFKPVMKISDLVNDDIHPLCMAKRIDELDAQVRVMRELLTRSRPYISDQADWGRTYEKCLLRDIDAAMPGSPLASKAPEGWQLVPVDPTEEILRAMRSCVLVESCYSAMLAAAPSLDSAK